MKKNMKWLAFVLAMLMLVSNAALATVTPSEPTVDPADCDHPNVDIFAFQYDEEGHWNVCPDCGEKLNEWFHFAYCTDPTHCYECGAPYAGDDITHDPANERYEYYDGEYHLRICGDGAMVEKIEHWAWCYNPTQCVDCGGSYAGDNFDHLYDSMYFKYDDEGCWYACKDCGRDVYNQEDKVPHSF